jgi:hypothetical protein
MKTETNRNNRISALPAALLATAFATALATQGAFAMVSEHDIKPVEASQSGVLIVSGAGPRGDVKYIRPDEEAEPVGYEIGGPVGRLAEKPAK